MDNKKTFGVGVCGCGKISSIYLTNMINKFQNLRVISCCAEHFESAEKRASQFGIEATTYSEMLRDGRVDIVVVLTPAPTHYALIRQALEAGKHVYTEKCITLETAQAMELKAMAAEKGLYLSSAPDTFLGSAHQSARRAIDEGKIGTVTGFSVSVNRCWDFLASRYSFLNLPGGGIDLDYGVYYMTQLINLLGPMESVFAMSDNYKSTRVNTNENSPDFGKEFFSPNNTRVCAAVRTKSGIPGTFLLDGESIRSDMGKVFVYGTEGVLTLCDSNFFGGKITLTRCDGETGAFVETAVDYDLPYSENSRGVGPAEMASAILEGRRSRTDCALAIHVLDIFETMSASAASGKLEYLKTTCPRPDAL